MHSRSCRSNCFDSIPSEAKQILNDLKRYFSKIETEDIKTLKDIIRFLGKGEYETYEDQVIEITKEDIEKQ